MLQGCLNVLSVYWWYDRHAISLTMLWRHRSCPLALHRWQPMIIAGGGGHRQCRSSTVMQRAGTGQSPQSSKMAGSILGASVELSQWVLEPRQASAVSIRGKRGYFDP